ncbi:hypothetical protein NDU88_000960 [Pleurodeles waltl]|uniref:Uncharacterized protein n=1 Tax=Pleurodeles waltl TaxID=8319 RepID=A0AAV7SBJ1_PLEWA|nr:hypothetical protein NDU88_000960 [Pleurodeles waltl]
MRTETACGLLTAPSGIKYYTCASVEPWGTPIRKSSFILALLSSSLLKRPVRTEATQVRVKLSLRLMRLLQPAGNPKWSSSERQGQEKRSCHQT